MPTYFKSANIWIVVYAAVALLTYLYTDWQPTNGLPQGVTLFKAVDLRVYVVALEKASLSENPYLNSDTLELRTQYSPRAFANVGLGKADVSKVFSYLYPPVFLQLFSVMPKGLWPAWHQIHILSVLAILSLLGLMALRKAPEALRIGAFLYVLVSYTNPFSSTLWNGQINIFLAFTIFWGLYLTQHKHVVLRWAGYVLTALGFWVKLLPIAFVGLGILAKKKLWPLLSLALALVVIAGLSYLQNPGLWQQYLGMFGTQTQSLQAMKEVIYHSFGIRGLLQSLVLPAVLQAVAYPIVAGGVVLVTAVSVFLDFKKGDVNWAYRALLPVGFCVYVLMPVSWDHHMAFYLAPLAIGLAAIAQTERSQLQAVLFYLLVGLLAFAATTPRLNLGTHNLLEVIAFRIATLAMLAALGVRLLMQLVPESKKVA